MYNNYNYSQSSSNSYNHYDNHTATTLTATTNPITRRSAAIKIVSPDQDSSTSSSLDATINDPTQSSTTPVSPSLKGALPPRAVAAAVFVPKKSNLSNDNSTIEESLVNKTSNLALATEDPAVPSPRLSARAPAHVPASARASQDSRTASPALPAWDDGQVS